MKKTTKIFLCAGILLWFTALVFATRYDLDISRTVINRGSLYGRAFEVLGEIPAVLFTSFNFALMALYFSRCTDFRGKARILAVLTFIGCGGTAIFTTVKTAKYIYGEMLHPLIVLYAVLIGAAIAFVFVMCAVFMSEQTLKKYFHTATRCALAAMLTLVIIWALKLTWGRLRPRDGGIADFTAWYLPQWFTGDFSFPSGHTANATVIFSVVYYFRFLGGKAKKFVPLFYTALTVWLALVAFSRVVIGAHFLSDVLFGCAITLAIVYFARPKGEF